MKICSYESKKIKIVADHSVRVSLDNNIWITIWNSNFLGIGFDQES